MTSRAIHQVVVGAGRGDAITSMAIVLRNALQALGPSEIYAHHLSSDVEDEVFPLHMLGAGRRGDLIVYHASIGEPAVTRLLLARPEGLVIIYHNITPWQIFLDHQPHFAANLHWGREELNILRERVVLAVAVSDFNARDLRDAGYSDVHVVPVGLRPGRLLQQPADGQLADKLHRAFPRGYVLTVSQMLPHKRFETIVQAMHLLQWVHGLELGLMFVGPHRMPRYHDALLRQVRRLRVERVWFFGGATDSELSTIFQMATVFASTSAHEGLALPPLEAMSFGVPVVARSAGAMEATMSGAGVLIPENSGPMLLSEAIAEVATNSALRVQLRRRGYDRVEVLEREDPAAQFMALIEGVR